MTQDMTSKVVFNNNVLITRARVLVEGSGDSLTFELGVAPDTDSAYVWETVTNLNNAIHTFTQTGGKLLKWRATGTNFTITRIEIKINP